MKAVFKANTKPVARDSMRCSDQTWRPCPATNHDAAFRLPSSRRQFAELSVIKGFGCSDKWNANEHNY